MGWSYNYSRTPAIQVSGVLFCLKINLFQKVDINNSIW